MRRADLLALLVLLASGCTRAEAAARRSVRQRSEVPPGTRACNGHRELCDRKYDQVVFPATHNAHSAREYRYSVNANQISGLSKQLEDGIRCMLMDVYPASGAKGTVFCHGVCSLGETPHLSGLAEIKRFMESHPNEVLTIIYEDHVEASAITADLQTAGLSGMTFTHVKGEPWPTLGEMIDRGTRLVVTAEKGGSSPRWFHHVWDVAFDTPFTFHDRDDFSCKLNRGRASNDLFLLNHWMSTMSPIDLPTEDGARIVNRKGVLEARANRCEAEVHHLPNFVAVDFYEDGDLFEVVDDLNGF
jgi:hypothetical protein